MNRIFVSLAICSALLLAGCGGGNKQAAPAQMAPAQIAPAQAAATGNSSTQAMQQQLTNLQNQVNFLQQQIMQLQQQKR